MDDLPKKPLDPQTPSDWIKDKPESTETPVSSAETLVNNIPPVQNTQSAGVSSTPQVEPPPQPTFTVPPAAPQPEAQQVPTPGISSEAVIETHPSGGGKGFKAFVIIGTLIILAIWAGVAYIYLQNRSLKSLNQGESDVTSVSATPTPSFSPDQVKIKSGSIIWEKPNGEVQILVNKEDYESTGITGFLKVAVSPDNSKLCFESWPPAPEPALYISGVDGTNVTEASPNRKNCLWAGDSKSVYYINSASDTAPINIFSYNIENITETDLTSQSVPSGVVRRYEMVGLSADATKIICKFEDIGGAATTDSFTNCEVNLETGEVTSL